MSYNSGSGHGYNIPPLNNNRSNYEDWKFKVSALLRIKGLMGITRGTEKCSPQTVEDPKDQNAVTTAFDRQHAWNDEAFGEIIMTLKKESTRKISHFEMALEVQNHLENCYQGKGQHTVVQLFVDVFKGYFVDTILMKEHLSDMYEKIHRLKDLGYDLKDLTIVILIMVSLPESYVLLRQYLYMQDENTLTMDFVIKQILLEENAHGSTPHVALVGDGKGKKPIYQFQGFSNDGNVKKKNMKCHYCKRKGHIKSECRKLKANLALGNVSDNKKGQGSRDQNAKVALNTQETLINLFMAHQGKLDLADKWIIDSGTTSPMTARKDQITNYTPFDIPISIGLGDDSIIKAIRSGSIRIIIDVGRKSKTYELCNIYYVLDMGANNLLFVTYMVKKGYIVDFGVNNCEIRKNGNAVGIAERKLGLWVLKGTTSSPDYQSAHIAVTSLHMWYKRLGYAMTQSIRKLSDQSIVMGLEITNEETTDADEHCIPCLKEKTTHNVIPKKSDIENPKRLHRVFSDVCGPFDVKGYSWCHYFVTLIDGFSHYV